MMQGCTAAARIMWCFETFTLHVPRHAGRRGLAGVREAALGVLAALAAESASALPLIRWRLANGAAAPPACPATAVGRGASARRCSSDLLHLFQRLDRLGRWLLGPTRRLRPNYPPRWSCRARHSTATAVRTSESSPKGYTGRDDPRLEEVEQVRPTSPSRSAAALGVQDKPRGAARVYATASRSRGSATPDSAASAASTPERSFAHTCGDGGGRRAWVRGSVNVSKHHMMRAQRAPWHIYGRPVRSRHITTLQSGRASFSLRCSAWCGALLRRVPVRRRNGSCGRWPSPIPPPATFHHWMAFSRSVSARLKDLQKSPKVARNVYLKVLKFHPMRHLKNRMLASLFCCHKFILYKSFSLRISQDQYGPWKSA